MHLWNSQGKSIKNGSRYYKLQHLFLALAVVALFHVYHRWDKLIKFDQDP